MSDIINVLVTIDTDKVIKKFPKPSKNNNLPTQLGEGYQYMVVSDNNAISGNEEIDLNLNFSTGMNKYIRIHGTSEYANFEKSILIYKIQESSGNKLFGKFKSRTFTKNTPEPSGPEVLAAKIVYRNFWFYEAEVSLLNKGTDKCQVWFALFVKGELYGYFYLDATIKAN